MKTYLLALALLISPSLAFAAEGGVTPAKLSAKEQVEVTRIQEYLNNLKNISADFLQVTDQGGMMTGKISIQRPGKMRVVYDAPSKDFIVADGDNVHIWNDELQSQTNVEEGSSLAEFILRDPVHLNGDVTITKLQHYPAKIEVTLVQTDDPASGSLTLVFEDKPLKLRQWKVLDPQGHTTGVNLQNMREDVSFSSSTFSFTAPSFGKGGGARK